MRLLFITFRGSKKGRSLSCCFAPISIALRPSKPASKPARGVLFQCPWSPDTGVRNFVSSYNFVVLLQFSIPLRPRGLP